MEEETIIEEEINQLLIDYEKLFNEVIKKCGVFACHNDYGAHRQLIQETFIRYAKAFSSRTVFDQECQLDFLYQRLCWAVYNVRSQQHCHRGTLGPDEQSYVGKETSSLNGLPHHFNTMWQNLSTEEQQLLEALSIVEWTGKNTVSYLLNSKFIFDDKKTILEKQVMSEPHIGK